MRHLTLLSSLCLLFALTCGAVAADRLPALTWQERSDWINVKTDVNPPAKGDGVTDDTAAIQRALRLLHSDAMGEDIWSGPKTVYFPPGNYKVSNTLRITGVYGGNLIGCGRNTRIFWDGTAGGVIFWSDGNPHMNYTGIVWDGMNKAGVGFDHRVAGAEEGEPQGRYESRVIHQHEAFINCTDTGFRTGVNTVLAISELLVQNCIFRHNGKGASHNDQNDLCLHYRGCLFQDNGIGIDNRRGNFRISECHFERSREMDIWDFEHAGGIHRVTSVGSRMFLYMQSSQFVCPTVIEDCQISGWTDPAGAIQFGSPGPLTLIDLKFANPPGANPPVTLTNPAANPAEVIYSNVVSKGTKLAINAGANSILTEIPKGKRGGNLKNAGQNWLMDKAVTPGKVFAVRDFGAVAGDDGDDTDAIQRAIDAARAYGKRAIVYFPVGEFHVSRTLKVTGGNYYIGGTGWTTTVSWKGPEAGGPVFSVVDPQNVVMEQFRIVAPVGVAMIRQTSETGGRSRVKYNAVFLGGGYNEQTRPGLECVDLPKGAVVLADWLDGTATFTNCSRATVIIGAHAEGPIIVQGDKYAKCGFMGFVHNEVGGVDYTAVVRDNQDLIVGDWYTEQDANYMKFEGNDRTPPGRVTIFGDKAHFDDPRRPMVDDRKMINIDNYKGRILLTNEFIPGNPSKEYFVYQQGTAPLDLMIVGSDFLNRLPTYDLGPGARLIHVGNTYYDWQSDPHQGVLPDEKPAGWETSIAAAFDDLSELGQYDLKYYFGK